MVIVVVTFRNLKDIESFKAEFEFDNIECAVDFIKDITLYNRTPIISFDIFPEELKLYKESDEKKVM